MVSCHSAPPAIHFLQTILNGPHLLAMQNIKTVQAPVNHHAHKQACKDNRDEIYDDNLDANDDNAMVMMMMMMMMMMKIMMMKIMMMMVSWVRNMTIDGRIHLPSCFLT